MRRRTSLSVSLAVGVVATLLTSWVPPLIHPPVVSFPGLSLDPNAARPWIGTPRSRWLGEPAWLGTEARFGVGVRSTVGVVETQEVAIAADSGRWHYLIAAGWPFYAFHGGGLQFPPTAPIVDERARAGLELPTWMPTRQNHRASIPVGPLWRGLVLDVALWSAASFGCLVVPGALRRAWRRARGRCEACGYPRRVPGPTCPECGAAFRSSADHADAADRGRQRGERGA